ncbi:MAG: glucosylceramidase [Clostridia bacterium]|nr:glucosylceramidase [Clostridia bacterium]
MKIKKIETNIKRNLYFDITNDIELSQTKENNNKIKINEDIKYQEFLGFGGAFTESAGYAISTVNNEIYNNIVDDYFSKEGLNYSFGRLPIGSCDFSLDSYSYSYENDLSDFSIQRDMKYIIPFIKSALNRNNSIKFISSPWSPPAFMKDNNRLVRGGKLKAEFKQTWADYLVQYVKEYNKQGINIDFMTLQNEPDVSQFWESCRYTAEDESDLLVNYLFPTFKKNNLNTKFLIWDHNKDKIVDRAKDCLIKYNANDFAAGIGFHWYTGSYFENLKKVNELFPDKLLIHTEGCTGYSKFKPKDELFNAELYASEIIGDLNSGVNAFVDWNLVLDYKGGPNHKRNYCNSPIMIDKNKNGYIKTPSYFYIGQFSKYIKPGAKRIEITSDYDNIDITAFENNDKSIVLVLLNKNDYNIEYDFCYKNYSFHDNLDSHAIVTLVL